MSAYLAGWVPGAGCGVASGPPSPGGGRPLASGRSCGRAGLGRRPVGRVVTLRQRIAGVPVRCDGDRGLGTNELGGPADE